MIALILFLASMFSFGTKHWIIGISCLVMAVFACG